MRDLEKFYLAIDNNDVEGLEELIQKNAALPDHIGPPPPLHWAIYQDRPEIVKVLLKYPLDVERRDSDRAATPLEYAIVYGRTEIIRLLLGHGVNTRGVIALANGLRLVALNNMLNCRVEQSMRALRSFFGK